MKIKPFPNKKYQIIYADPPWKTHYMYGGKKAGTIGDRKLVPYKTLTDDEIMNLPVEKIVSDNALLFLWTIESRIPKIRLFIESWGFKYNGIAFVWNKRSAYNLELTRTTLTLYTRRSCEMCFLGLRGKTKNMVRDHYTLQFINEPIPDRRIHSSKPKEARNRIVQLCGDIPRIELFAREKTEGWDVWGDEV